METRKGAPDLAGFTTPMNPKDSQACRISISPLGIILYFCLYKTREDIKNIIVIKVLRGV